jgi:hypothetical protein
MKKLILTLSAIFISMVLFVGCDKVDDLNTVKFDASFTGDVTCNTAGGLKSSLNNPVFAGSAVIEPTSDPNVNIYLSNIKSYDIQSVKATITSMSQENVTLIAADLDIYNFQHMAKWSFQNELLTTGKTLTFGNETGQWDIVGDILKDGQEFTVQLIGEADFSGVTFTVKVEIETKVEANII